MVNDDEGCLLMLSMFIKGNVQAIVSSCIPHVFNGVGGFRQLDWNIRASLSVHKEVSSLSALSLTNCSSTQLICVLDCCNFGTTSVRFFLQIPLSCEGI